jgi:hypothetical protein
VIESFKIARTIVGTATRALFADLLGVGTTGDDANAERVPRAQILQPHGLAARPTISDTLEAFAVRLGAQVIGLVMVDHGAAALSPALEEGEVRLHNLAGAYLRERADGAMELVTASGKAIRLGAAGGTADKPVAHEGSRTTGHTHTITFALTAPSGGGAVTGTITAANADDSIKTGEGSANVLVPDT